MISDVREPQLRAYSVLLSIFLFLSDRMFSSTAASRSSTSLCSANALHTGSSHAIIDRQVVANIESSRKTHSESQMILICFPRVRFDEYTIV
jgi:hypothetical protein